MVVHSAQQGKNKLSFMALELLVAGGDCDINYRVLFQGGKLIREGDKLIRKGVKYSLNKTPSHNN